MRHTLHGKTMPPVHLANPARALRKKTYLCLMAGLGSYKNSVTSFDSNDDENKCYQLLNAFHELHEKAKKLQYSNNRYRGKNMWLEDRLKQLKDKNENLKTNLKTIENAHKNLYVIARKVYLVVRIPQNI